ncbi:AAA domain-containing protein [Psychrobacillus sp. NEAU-3TGS]|uniref:DEAD/DEAH box helicase n=1 Tax=Psychrobacillus sp. NEAU-3TGS TaxID=2995412 RepID=UPI0024983733|nr:AAA domain-containing protein [Psychrobacillus sp. NEAU-3TGS]MDI2586795.1 AAA domain-containing protein [Psychrobacillus sp. NEAU-3TGS]
MRQVSIPVKTMRCNLMMTNKARGAIHEWAVDEHAFFRMQESFEVHIEKRPVNSHGNTPVALYFDNVSNESLAGKLEGRIGVMECILQTDGLLATNFYIRGTRVPVKTNRRLSVDLNFVTARNNGAGMPIQLHTSIRELPVAEERSEYVKKRISSWEGYLKIQERNADIADITAAFSKFIFNEDFNRLTLIGSNVKENEWNKLKGLSVSIKGFQNDIGEVLKVDRAKKTIEIELKPRFQEMARRNQWHPKWKEAVFSNFSTLSQIRRLRKGFEDLQNGLAANANLENILFEKRPTINVTNKKKDLEFHNQLNEFQQEAVVGAMSAEDLYVIQGPPGTGKTTVISEICQQNAKAGLRTLVASQSNLAVDNALSRLLSNKDIRILRFGRTESIEEEGKRFIEENVGGYWKDQTINALQEEINSHPLKEKQLIEEIALCKEHTVSLEQQVVLLKEKIERKQLAQIEFAERMKEIKELKKRLIHLKKEREELENNHQHLKQITDERSKEIEQMEQFIQANPTTEELVKKIERLQLEIDQTSKQIMYQQVLQESRIVEGLLIETRNAYQAAQSKVNHLEQFSGELHSISKIDFLKIRMNDCEIIPSYMLEQQMTNLDKLIETIISFADWGELNKRLLSAIGYIEGLLKKNNVSLETVKSHVNSSGVVFDSTYSVKEIHQFIDSMKRLLTSGSANIERLEVYLEGLNVRKEFVWKQGAILQKAKADSANMFMSIKAELTEQVKQEKSMMEQSKSEWKIKGITQNEELQQLQRKVAELHGQLDNLDSIPSLQQLQIQLQDKESTLLECNKVKDTIAEYTAQLELKKNEFKTLNEHLGEALEELEKNKQETKQVNSEGLEQEKQLKALEELLKQNPEEALEKALTKIAELEERITATELEKNRLPITQSLQNEWFTMLKEANDHDLDEIRKLYVRHANVIGTTCVASARKEFMDNYPIFDVVIIDEVSKATPPELLLPMLKGKKIILVGDHHQLPPLVGEDTLDETLKAILEESDSFEEKDELKKLLKESLFERLFKNLPKTNKTMLAIQYRMHENIMKTITPFYEEENYRLQCGLVDSDAMRDHLLDSHYVKRQDHLLWLDMPNEKQYFEERMKNGKSRFNQAELDTIREVLIDLDKATETAKNEGRLAKEEQKSIGVISFYGEQVKRIDRLIQLETNFKHLNFRTGTVDKFQGMEMDVIILSMVRNNQDKSGDIGFANDYRRLNVALSRARELLILVGSTNMFTTRAKQKDSREMYSRLLSTVKKQNGYRNQRGQEKK